LDEVGRRSTCPAVGPGRRKDKCNYRGPQIEAEDNFDHKVHQRGEGHEETIGRTHNYADIEKGVPGSNRTPPGERNKGHCIGRGSQNTYGTN
jgi:hypothetical protein